MHTTKIITRGALAAILLAGTAACSSSGGNFADRAEDIAEDWRDGKKDVEKGREAVEDGRKDLKKAQRSLDDERSELRDAERELAVAKEAYNAALVLSDAASTAAALEDKESPLFKLRKRVNKAEEEVKDSRGDIEDDQKDIRDARKKISKGEERMKKGERQMIEAETAYKLEPGADPKFFDRLFD